MTTGGNVIFWCSALPQFDLEECRVTGATFSTMLCKGRTLAIASPSAHELLTLGEHHFLSYYSQFLSSQKSSSTVEGMKAWLNLSHWTGCLSKIALRSMLLVAFSLLRLLVRHRGHAIDAVLYPPHLVSSQEA